MLGLSCTESQGLWEGDVWCGLQGSTDGARRLMAKGEGLRKPTPLQAAEMAVIYSHLYSQTSKGSGKDRHSWSNLSTDEIKGKGMWLLGPPFPQALTFMDANVEGLSRVHKKPIPYQLWFVWVRLRCSGSLSSGVPESNVADNQGLLQGSHSLSRHSAPRG